MTAPTVPAPPAPPPPDGTEGSANRSLGPVLIAALVVLTLLVGLVVTAILGVFLLRVSSVGDSFSGQLPGRPDIEMQVHPSSDTGADADARLQGEDRTVFFESQPALDGTVRFIGTFAGPSGSADLFRWSMVSPDAGDDDLHTCNAWFELQSPEGGTICGPATGRPDAHWSTSEGTLGTSFSVMFTDLPESAVEVQTLTASGRIVSSPVLEGAAYHAWPAAEGEPGGFLPGGGREFWEGITAAAFDDAGNVVWSVRNSG